MDVGPLIQTYGYAAVAVGSLFEGETVLVAAGLAAHQGYLDLPTVVAIATCASFLGDQAFFWAGRRHGPDLTERFPALVPRLAAFDRRLQRYRLPLVLAVRFLYGLRIAGPIAIGMSTIPWRQFLLLNLAGAALWALAIGGSGYAFGQALELLIEDVRRHEPAILAGILALGIMIWLAARMRSRRSRHGRP